MNPGRYLSVPNRQERKQIQVDTIQNPSSLGDADNPI